MLRHNIGLIIVKKKTRKVDREKNETEKKLKEKKKEKSKIKKDLQCFGILAQTFLFLFFIKKNLGKP